MRLAPLALALLAAGCGARNPPEPAPDAGADAGLETFIALEPDFASFEDWPRVVLPDDNTGSGVRTVYINRKPEHGSAEFPVGTILVKRTDTSAPVATVYDGMVKRGGGFNASGAVNWEWFEFDRPPDAGSGPLLIRWRGVTPPVGQGYSGGRGGTCNDCHGHFPQQDYVQTPQYQLGNF